MACMKEEQKGRQSYERVICVREKEGGHREERHNKPVHLQT